MFQPGRRLAPELRQQEILDCAEKLLRSDGLSVRVADITNAAGIAKGTFFSYFQSFDDLLDAIRARRTQELRQHLAEVLSASSVAESRQDPLICFAGVFIDFLIDLEGLHEVLFHSAFTQARPMPPQSKPPAAIAVLLHEGIRAGSYARLDADMAAPLIFAAIHETADQIIAGADRGTCLAALGTLLHRVTHAPVCDAATQSPSPSGGLK